MTIRHKAWRVGVTVFLAAFLVRLAVGLGILAYRGELDILRSIAGFAAGAWVILYARRLEHRIGEVERQSVSYRDRLDRIESIALLEKLALLDEAADEDYDVRVM